MTTVVDLFAGAGGFSLAAARAGCHVAWAANHSPTAVAAHRTNHPGCRTALQDLRQADWRDAPRPDLLLAAPACQGHSRAATHGGGGRRGGAPKHDADRSTAWAVVSCLEVHRPPLALVENVPEFRRWALYPAWRAALAALGYSAAEHLVDAAWCGVPQHRVRLFVALSRSRSPLRLRLPGPGPAPAFGPCLDEGASGWAPVAQKSPAVRARVAAGRARLGPGDFLSQHVTGHRGRELSRPIGTITAAGCSHWHLVRGAQMRPLSLVELRRAQGFPDAYVLPEGVATATRLLGNAVAPPCGEVVIRAALRAA